MKKKKKYVSSFIILLVLLYTFISNYVTNNSSENKYQKRQIEDSKVVSNLDNLDIYFMDVGQADSILISCGDKNMLIDAGNNEDGIRLVKYFKDKGIEKFDYVIATHAHEDHIGGMDDIIDNFNIDNFLMSTQITTTKTFEDMLDALDRNGFLFTNPNIGDTYKLNDATFEILYLSSDESDINDSSIVLKLVYGNNSFLFMGDASSNIEDRLLDNDLKSDVLKVGHHGSDSSTSIKFLNKVTPKYAVISVGNNNTYNHPRKVTIDRLEDIGSKIYRTDLDGTIHMKSDGINIQVETFKTDTNG